ncbi:hypothetical protein GN956_G14936 [Arapaima gigas]
MFTLVGLHKNVKQQECVNNTDIPGLKEELQKRDLCESHTSEMELEEALIPAALICHLLLSCAACVSHVIPASR